MIIGIDFDGTVVETTKPLRLRPGVEDTLRAFVEMEHQLVLHSVRCNAPITDDVLLGRLYPGGKIPMGLPRTVEESWEYFEEMRDFLRSKMLWTVEEGGVFSVIWQLPGKPPADAFLDDRTINVRGKEAWQSVRFVFGGG